MSEFVIVIAGTTATGHHQPLYFRRWSRNTRISDVRLDPRPANARRFERDEADVELLLIQSFTGLRARVEKAPAVA